MIAYFTAPKVDDRFISATGIVVNLSQGRLISNDLQPIVYFRVSGRVFHVIEFFDNDGVRQIGNLFYSETGRSSYKRPATKNIKIGDIVNFKYADVSKVYRQRALRGNQNAGVNIAVLDTDKIVWEGFPIRFVLCFLLNAFVLLTIERILKKIKNKNIICNL
ncbi:MAG: hypothetical protein FWG98_03965 [Candidatus Cloacimonetes bacterium]|nr:hypothetical protein [Candidatus Cloacimonadota bacterium]